MHLTRLSLDVSCPNWHETPSLSKVVIDNDRVWAVNPAAARLGARVGMRRASITALAPDASLLERDPSRETAALDGIAMCLLQYTPELALAEQDSLLLDVGASLLAFGGPRRLCHRIRASLLHLGFHARLGMAPTAQGAWLLARHPRASRRRATQHTTLARRLAALPCSLLPLAQPHRAWLDGIGCRTLGELDALPRAGLQRRCGTDLLAALDRAHGRATELFTWIVPPALFQARLELVERIEHTHAVMFVAQRLIHQMTGWLTARHKAVTRIELLLEHEKGRHAIAPTTVQISLAEPACHPEHLLRLLKENLGALELGAPVIAVALNTPDIVDRPPPSESLFPEPGGTAADHRRLLELLKARLGVDNVLQPTPVADHRPEAANMWSPAPVPRQRETFPPPPATRPFWLLDTPIALVMQQHRPVYGSRLRMLQGPDRIESGWWDDGKASRDYYIAECEKQCRYWIYQERSDDMRWFLHGKFA